MFKRLNIAVLVLVLVLSSGLFFTSSQPALADGPDFSNVNDILGGRRTLFRDDDMVAIQLPSSGDLRATTLLTAGDAVESQTTVGVSGPSNYATGIGRMFNFKYDASVTVIAGAIYLDTNTPSGQYSNLFLNNLGGETVSQDVITQADFTGDDLTDFAFVENGNLNVFTAADVNDPTQGFFFATPTALPQTSPSLVSLAAGDVDADSITELVIATYALDFIQIDVYKPNVTTNGQGNVTALSLDHVGSTSIFVPETLALALTAGVYSGTTNPANGISYNQLLLYYQQVEQDDTLTSVLQPISVASPNPPQVTFTLGNPLTFAFESSLNAYGLVSDYLDFFGNVEQVVMMQQPLDAQGILRILSFDSQLNLSIASEKQTTEGFGLTSVAVGNFDQQGTNSSPLVLELAVFGNLSAELVPVLPCLPFETIPFVVTFHIDPNTNYALSFNNDSVISDRCYDNNDPLPLVSGVTGDLQGRSLLLGTPTKITSDTIDPHLIVGSPPMHVDYVTPVGGGGPTVLNISTVPRAFYSSYQTQVTGATQSSHTGSTSFTNAAKVSVTGGYQFGGAQTGSVSVTAGASAGFMNNKFVQKQHGSYTGESFDVSTNTGYGDQLWISEMTENIYAFPVIGQTVCPEGSVCPPTAEVPRIVLLSGPSNQQDETVNGTQVEWYQPVHEPGNLFSYPWNLQQLELREGDIDQLTSVSEYVTDSSATTAQASWTGQNSQSVTSGNTNQLTWSSFLSIVKKAGALGGSTGSLKVQYNGSKAFSTLNTDTSTLGASTGIGIHSSGTFANPAEYQYQYVPYIFGNNPVSGTIQTINLGTAMQTSGILRAQFTADPTVAGSGAWWSQAYPLPDIAVAHPARWSNKLQNDSDAIPANCLRVSALGTPSDCMYFNPPLADIWTSEFHWMKGMLITPAGANGEGPQIDHIEAGEGVELTTRVYNNSLTDTPAGSQMVVQFYGQPWNQVTHTPAGNAFLIDNVTLNQQLPGFNSTLSGGVNPNWTTASTTLDTTPYSDQYLVFWVVVVLKDAQGDPVAEMPAHGLTGIPPTLTSIADATQWTEQYSNNVGFYKSTFYVAPSGSQTAAAAVSGSQTTEAALAKRLTLDSVELSKTKALLGDKVIVSGMFRASAEMDGFSALLHDGKKKTALFDVEEVSHIRANDAFLVKTVYQAETCGAHTLAITALNGKVRKEATLNVTINAKKAVKQIAKEIKALGLGQGRSNTLGELVREAKKALKNKDTKSALDTLNTLQDRIKALNNDKLSAETKALLLSQIAQFLKCVN